MPTYFRVESPIEEALLLALCHVASVGGEFTLRRAVKEPPSAESFARSAVIIPQQELGPWRVDFLVIIRAIDPRLNLDRMAVIECDGHEWHDRTPEQASRDKARDRYFAERGICVMRFTGRDIWRDPVRCANQVDEMIKNIVTDWQVEIARLDLQALNRKEP